MLGPHQRIRLHEDARPRRTRRMPHPRFRNRPEIEGSGHRRRRDLPRKMHQVANKRPWARQREITSRQLTHPCTLAIKKGFWWAVVCRTGQVSSDRRCAYGRRHRAEAYKKSRISGSRTWASLCKRVLRCRAPLCIWQAFCDRRVEPLPARSGMDSRNRVAYTIIVGSSPGLLVPRPPWTHHGPTREQRR